MGKYTPLYYHLIKCGKEEIKMTFSEVERIVGFQLPKSAYTYERWWNNNDYDEHPQSRAWIDAGYRTAFLDIPNRSVCFVKGSILKNTNKQKQAVRDEANLHTEVMTVCGYPFRFLQTIEPERDESGKIKEFYPQSRYNNRHNKPLNNYGDGAFCHFSINVGDWPGVYLWVVENQIIYIGETFNLRSRFNTGYGDIQPVNCYVGGQTTNCKMNKVVMNVCRQGKTIKLFFFSTTDYKQVELDLLSKIKTQYNIKDNI